jgi:GT2 family glycosyltransferase
VAVVSPTRSQRTLFVAANGARISFPSSTEYKADAGLSPTYDLLEVGSLALQEVNDRLLDDDHDFFIFVGPHASISSEHLAALSTFLKQENCQRISFFDSVGASGPVKRPAHSPERLRSQFFWGEVLIVPRTVFTQLHGFNLSNPGAEVYDFALRSVRSGVHVSHYPVQVCFQTDVSEYTWSLCGIASAQSIENILNQHLHETGGGVVLSTSATGLNHTQREVKGSPLVSIIIPTRATISGNGESLLRVAVQSIHDMTTYSNYEIVLVVDEGYDKKLVEDLRKLCGPILRTTLWDKPFNFSGKVNLGAVTSAGEYLLILNDDVKVITPTWIEALLALAQLPNAGMSGCMLYYEDNSIQHAGHAYRDNHASHVGLDEPYASPGPLDGYKLEREIGGVTAACCLLPREVYYKAGGFSTLLPGAFNDVDLCMKITSAGYQIYWTPFAELYHYESKSRDAKVRSFEVDITWGRWGNRFWSDPFWPYPLSRTPA